MNRKNFLNTLEDSTSAAPAAPPKPAMTERTATSFRVLTPSTAAVCRTHLAALREEWHAAYVRQLYAIQQSGAWLGVFVLWAQAGLAYCSLQILSLLFPRDVPESWLAHHLGRILAFCKQPGEPKPKD